MEDWLCDGLDSRSEKAVTLNRDILKAVLDLVFCSSVGTPLDAANVRRTFKRLAKAVLGGDWTPRELRTSFVSLMSDSGVPVEEIARLVGHTSSRTTEVVYRRELRPVITTGAEVNGQDLVGPADMKPDRSVSAGAASDWHFDADNWGKQLDG